AGRMHLTPKELHLHQTLEEIVDVFAQRALDKGLRLDLEVAEGAPAYVRCDGGKLRQVVANLLSNAIKFTTEGHVSVTVAAAPAPGLLTARAKVRVVVCVTDTGAGISPEEAARMFQPFEQGLSADKVREGTGLGLAISQRLARLLDGDVWLESTSHSGSVFRFEFECTALATLNRESGPADL